MEVVAATKPGKDLLKQVLGKWLPSHCHKAKMQLRAMLGLHATTTGTGPDNAGAGGGTSNVQGMVRGNVSSAAESGFRVKVETAAGVIVAQFHVDEAATVHDVKLKVNNVAKQFPVADQQFLVSGYERHGVLKDDASVLKNVLDRIFSAESTIDEGIGDGSQDSSARATLNQGDEVCLCLVLSNVRWSKSRSSTGLNFGDDGKSVQRQRFRDEVFAVGSLCLTECGHFFTVQIAEQTTRYISIGIACETQVPHSWARIPNWNLTFLDINTLSIWSCPGRRWGVRALGTEMVPQQEASFKVGDKITVALGQRDDGSLAVIFSVNGTTISNIRVTIRKPPFIPLCKLTDSCRLVMVGGCGQPLQAGTQRGNTRLTLRDRLVARFAH